MVEQESNLLENNGNWIKLFSRIQEWEWYKDGNTFRLFIHLLLNANWKDGKFKGIDVPRGSLIVGRKQLSEELQISEQSIRTSLNRLKSTNEITIKTTNKFSLVCIIKYSKYQQVKEKSTNEITNNSTNNQPTTNQQLTTIEEYKNIEYKNISSNTTTNNILNIYNYAEENFGRTLSSLEIQLLSKLQENHPLEIIVYAIDISIEKNKKFLAYVEGTIDRWDSQNLKDLDSIKQHCENYKNNKSKNKTNLDILNEIGGESNDV